MTSPSDPLTTEEGERLLGIARQALEDAVCGQAAWQPDVMKLPARLAATGACFVTLTTAGGLHGCIGSVEPRLPLALDVVKNARNAALYDPRFDPLRPQDLAETAIEISVLSPMQQLDFQHLDHLISQLQPQIDGVMAVQVQGQRRSLLLPQVWHKLPDAHDFLRQVALKAGGDLTLFSDGQTSVYRFQVVSFFQPAGQEVCRDQ